MQTSCGDSVFSFLEAFLLTIILLATCLSVPFHDPVVVASTATSFYKVPFAKRELCHKSHFSMFSVPSFQRCLLIIHQRVLYIMGVCDQQVWCAMGNFGSMFYGIMVLSEI